MNSGRHRSRAAASMHHQGPASAEVATRLRRQLIAWAAGEGVHPDVTYDMGLASYEAMANTVTHAYPRGTVGPLELHAELENGTVVVTVSDHGRWPEEDAPGNGLALIRELAADSEVDRGRYGTTIRMSWPRGDGTP